MNEKKERKAIHNDDKISDTVTISPMSRIGPAICLAIFLFLMETFLNFGNQSNLQCIF